MKITPAIDKNTGEVYYIAEQRAPNGRLCIVEYDTRSIARLLVWRLAHLGFNGVPKELLR